MPKYLEANALINKFIEAQSTARTIVDREYLDGVIHIIENEPAANVKPVEYARWIREFSAGNSPTNRYRCSHCNKLVHFSDIEPKDEFCRNCGYTMK